MNFHNKNLTVILFGCSVSFKCVTSDHYVHVLSIELFKFTKPLFTSYSTKRKLPKTKILAITIKLFTKETFSISYRKMLKRIPMKWGLTR